MTWIAGVDGCRGGWIVVLRNVKTSTWELRLCSRFHDVIALSPQPKITAIDIPIGLLTTPLAGGRDCDREARGILSNPRQRSVFSPPSRPALAGNTFREAQLRNQPVGITQQTFGLFPKLREVDAVMTPQLQERVKEVHPELCFFAANKEPMQDSKKRRNGMNERLGILSFLYRREWNEGWNQANQMFARQWVALDDIIDAHIACWTAERIFNREAQHIPENPQNPPIDENGLRMEMWF